MKMMFDVVVSSQRMEMGKKKMRTVKIKESYLIPAMSFTEAEARTHKEAKALIGGDFSVSSIKRANYSEIWTDSEDLRTDNPKFFKGKVFLVTLNEKSGKEKKTAIYVLVEAKDLQGAKDSIVSNMKGTMSDYQIETVSSTKIVEVF